MDKMDVHHRLMAVKSKLFRVALTMLRNEEDAEDVVQDAYLKIWSDKNNTLIIPEAFAMRIVKNLCIDRLRSQQRRPTVNVEEQQEMHENFTPFQSVSFDNLKDLMVKLFQTLPEQQKLIIHLRDIEHMEFEEIEEITGLTINNIRVALSRARQSVRSSYQKIKNYENRRYKNAD